MMLSAKAFTYALNAYLDAQICEEIVSYITSNGKSFATRKTIAQERAENLIAVDNNVFRKDQNFLIGLAYTQYYLNGLADILYANLIWSIPSSKKNSQQTLYNKSIKNFRTQLTSRYQFEEIICKPGIYIWYWPIAVLTPWKWIHQFAKERCNYTGTLNKSVLWKASIEVQRQNRENNNEVAQAIINKKRSGDPKVIELRKVAQHISNSSAFLSEAAATQQAAAKWDKLFISIVMRLK